MERMFELFLHQERLLFLVIILGLVILVAAKTIPLKFLATVSTWPGCSPDWMTLWGVVIFYLAIVSSILRFSYFLPVAAFLFLASEAMDWLDGRIARAMMVYGVHRTDASVKRGAWVDPLADKARHLPAIACLMMVMLFSPYIAIPVILIDIAGTFVRAPFTEKPFTKYGAFRFIKSHLRQTQASLVGKIKSLLQAVAVAIGALYHYLQIEADIVPNLLLGIALTFGVLSVLSRIKISRDVDKAVDEVYGVFVTEKPSS